MKTIMMYAICCSVLGSLLITRSSPLPPSATSKTIADSDAAAVWEQAIAAKGGRQRLSTVHNILEFYTDKTLVGLYVPPDRFWRWADDRPTRLGVYVVMDNVELSLSYRMEGNTASPPENLGKRHAKEGLWEIYYAQLYYLLETQWLKPRPVKVHSGMIEHRPVDIIQTVVQFPQAPRAVDAGYRVDFYLDKYSHLPLEIAFPSNDSQGISYGRGTYYVMLADYADENGIQIPRKIGHMRKPDIPVTVQFNVDYDANIFERPPTVKAGPDAWRSRLKKT